MRTWRIVASATTAAALTTALCAAAPVAAEEQEPEPLPITVEPDTVTVGDSFTVSGADCLNDDESPGDVQVDIFSEGSDEPDSFSADVNDDGTWSLELQAEEADVGLLAVTATCFVSPESDEVVADYDFALLTVNPVTPPPTTAPPATEPPPPEHETPPPPAPPAMPVTGEPVFTG